MAQLRLEWPQVEEKEVHPEEKTMYDQREILAWTTSNVEGMRLSRCKTLAAIVGAALLMKGVGVPALGRAGSGDVAAKHCIKRVWRFLRNEDVEREALYAALFRFLRPTTGRTIILVDWTDLVSCNEPGGGTFVGSSLTSRRHVAGRQEWPNPLHLDGLGRRKRRERLAAVRLILVQLEAGGADPDLRLSLCPCRGFHRRGSRVLPALARGKGKKDGHW